MKILFYVLFLHVTGPSNTDGCADSFIPGTADTATTEIELSISAENLRSADLLSKSDPMCVVYIKSLDTKEWKEYFRTEMIHNNCNPQFASKVNLLYNFEEQQPLKFELYDVDKNSPNLNDHDFLGFAICNLGQIISSGGVKLQLESKTGSGKIKSIESYILLRAEELTHTDGEVIFQMNGHGLDKKDFGGFGKSDPFIEIHKSTENNVYVLVHRTAHMMNTTKPKWEKFDIPIKTLCNGDYDRSLKFECWDWNFNGSPSLIGEFYTTLKELKKKKKFYLIHPEKKKNKRIYINSGRINLEYFKINTDYSFMDYIKGGVQIHGTVAIDFTSSNGVPSDSFSLHYVSDAGLNGYEEAIMAIVPIIEDYDSDKKFPVLGFGARLTAGGPVSHDFPVNMNPDNPNCDGAAGVLREYRNCIRKVTLYRPTNFAPIINYVIKFGREYTDGMNYIILLVLTDGAILDMPETVQAIVTASRLPISIIIIGIGDADFTKMKELDNDDKDPLESDNLQKAQRDIVQFVPFNKCRAQGDPRTVERRLAKEVLAEIPKQVSDFMKSNGIEPRPPKLDPTYLFHNQDPL